VLQIADCDTGALVQEIRLSDVCGLASDDTGFVITSGQGVVAAISADRVIPQRQHDLAWDNHLIPLS
jgi:hypothetical protein